MEKCDISKLGMQRVKIAPQAGLLFHLCDHYGLPKHIRTTSLKAESSHS